MGGRRERSRDILWRVRCEGHVDAWVIAADWPLATQAAAAFWGVPWREVAAKCEEVSRLKGAPRNVCAVCGRIYFGAPPLCAVCEKAAKLEEAETRRRMRVAYAAGRL